jgi:hypothetical protein
LLGLVAELPVPFMKASASVRVGKLLTGAMSDWYGEVLAGVLTFGLDSIGLHLTVLPAVVYAWLASHLDSIKFGRAPFPFSTRSIRGR